MIELVVGGAGGLFLASTVAGMKIKKVLQDTVLPEERKKRFENWLRKPVPQLDPDQYNTHREDCDPWVLDFSSLDDLLSEAGKRHFQLMRQDLLNGRHDVETFVRQLDKTFTPGNALYELKGPTPEVKGWLETKPQLVPVVGPDKKTGHINKWKALVVHNIKDDEQQEWYWNE